MSNNNNGTAVPLCDPIVDAASGQEFWVVDHRSDLDDGGFIEIDGAMLDVGECSILLADSVALRVAAAILRYAGDEIVSRLATPGDRAAFARLLDTVIGGNQ